MWRWRRRLCAPSFGVRDVNSVHGPLRVDSGIERLIESQGTESGREIWNRGPYREQRAELEQGTGSGAGDLDGVEAGLVWGFGSELKAGLE